MFVVEEGSSARVPAAVVISGAAMQSLVESSGLAMAELVLIERDTKFNVGNGCIKTQSQCLGLSFPALVMTRYALWVTVFYGRTLY